MSAEAPTSTAKWRAWLEPAVIAGSLVALCVFVRLLWLEPLEISGDNTYKWNFVRQWSHANDFSHAQWSHHMARLGINVPLYFVQAFSSETPGAYYIFPVASYTLQVLLVYLLGRHLGGRAVGVLSAVWLTLFTEMNRDASQLLPDAVGGTAMVLTFYLLVRFHDAEGRARLRFLIGTGLAFVWAYFVKESNLLLLPGLLAAVWLCRRRWQDAAVVAGLLAAAFVLETAAYRLFTDYSSRFAMVKEAHGVATVTFPQLFNRFTRLEPAWQIVMWSWMASALGLLATRDARIQGLLLIPATFIFLLTFLVRDIDPIILWTRFMSRYFGATLPLMIVAVLLFCAGALSRAWPMYVPPSWQGVPGKLGHYAAPLTVAFCALVAVVANAWSERAPAEHPLRLMPPIAEVVNDAYARNLPIVEEKTRGKAERARGLEAIYAVFLKQERILTSDLAKDGRLPDVQEVVRYEKVKKKQGWRYAWLVRDNRVYDKEKVRELEKRGCAVRVNIEQTRFFTMKAEKLPARCQAPAR